MAQAVLRGGRAHEDANISFSGQQPGASDSLAGERTCIVLNSDNEGMPEMPWY